MSGDGKNKQRFIADRYVLISLLCVIIIILMLANICFKSSTTLDKPEHTLSIVEGLNKSGDTSGMVWTTTTKTSGGLPIIGNDVYNTLGFEISGNDGSYAYFTPETFLSNNSTNGMLHVWSYSFIIMDIASARIKGINAGACSIKSQYIEVKRPYDHVDQTINTGTAYSWPSMLRAQDCDYLNQTNQLNLTSQVVDKMNHYTIFPVTATEFDNQSGYGYDVYAPGAMAKWVFTPLPEGSLSDAGVAYYLLEDNVPAGGTIEFDIIAHTDFGLVDTSEATMHVKIKAPGDPRQMSANELEENGIKGDLTGATDINGNMTYYDYTLDPGHISVEVT